jgi:hypothetical protein
MQNFLKSAAIAVASAAWVVGLMGVVNRWLLISMWEREPNHPMIPQSVRYLENARTDLVISGIWLMVVIVFWVFWTRRTILDLHKRVADLEARHSQKPQSESTLSAKEQV